MRTDIYGEFLEGGECFVADTVIGFPIECVTADECPVNQFCATADGACGEMGECQASPTLCEPGVGLVCGCDGMTYDNACEASAAGTSVDTEGPCDGGGGPTVCGGIAGVACAEGEFCFIEDGLCIEDAEGVCLKQPEECPEDVKPVCSCEGKELHQRLLRCEGGCSRG